MDATQIEYTATPATLHRERLPMAAKLVRVERERLPANFAWGSLASPWAQTSLPVVPKVPPPAETRL
jgi:hypothetical protein